jgi:altronate dehydratase small subunit
MTKWDAIILNEADQVATALRNIESGEVVLTKSGDSISEINIKEEIPLCHKFAVRNIAAQEAINKYGEPIGAASEEIQVGHHVHIHNLKSLRASIK